MGAAAKVFVGIAALLLAGWSVVRFLLPPEYHARLQAVTSHALHAAIAKQDASAPPIRSTQRAPHIDLAEIDEDYFRATAARSVRDIVIKSYRAYKAGRFDDAIVIIKQADSSDRSVALMRALALLTLTDPDTFRESMQLIQRLVREDEPRATIALALMSFSRASINPLNVERGRELLRIAANKDTTALRVLAEGYLAGWIGITDPSRSIALLKEADARGDLKATFRLVEHYFTGTGTPKDNATAEHYLIKAAQAGHIEAQALLGTWRLMSIAAGLTEDATPALLWLEKAAAADHPRALEWLGQYYVAIAERIGQADLPRGVAYFKRCAEISVDRDCTYAYAYALDNGFGIKQDLIMAAAMYAIANRDGASTKASKRLDEIQKNLSAAERARAIEIRDLAIQNAEQALGKTTNWSKQVKESAARMRYTR